MKKRLTSQDKKYATGSLSVFPDALDSYATLFEAKNNLETRLSHKLMSSDKYLIVEDATNFPNVGILRISAGNNSEIIHYEKKIGNQFHNLRRGPSVSASWQAGSTVGSAVMADYHNSLKDAVIKIQRKIGLAETPDQQSLHGIVRTLEHRWLTPRAAFKAFPTEGPPPLTVQFQNFSTGQGLHYLWDFGDGITSAETNPSHTYLQEGKYAVRLSVVSATSAQGFTEKPDYVAVTAGSQEPFFYCRPLAGKENTEFSFVDQTDGDIKERHWFFDDGTDEITTNPNNHTAKHVYNKAGEYKPTLIIKYADGRVSRAGTEKLTVF